LNWLLVLGISLANNLDNTGVGVAYGLRRIRISPLVNGWISIITFLLTGSAVMIGSGVGHFLPAIAAKALSACILCAIGISVLAPALRHPVEGKEPSDNVLARILEDPNRADMDGSKHIDLKEGTILGIALSINNIGGGIGAGLVHLSVLWTAGLSAAFSFFVLWLGGYVGSRVGSGRFAARAPLVAGGMLIVIGLCQFR